MMSRFVSTDIQGHVLNPLIKEKLLSYSHDVTDNVQPFLSTTKKIRKRLDSSYSLLNFAHILKRLLQLKKLMRLFISKYC